MDDCPKTLESVREKVRGTNINEQTLLATDYLNHLNGPIMLFEMLPDAPELLEELAVWRPKTYVEHFADSTFTDKDLAIEAYGIAPAMYREPFDDAVDSANRCIAAAIDALTILTEQGRTDDVRVITAEVSDILGALVDKASSIIHGKVTTMGQTQIDQIMGT